MAQSRRELHFEKVGDVIKDAESLAAAERAGKLQRLGNWTLGQSCGHIAAWMDFSFDGIPIKMPWIVRIVARRMKKRFVNKPMNPGGRIPGKPNGTVAFEVLPTDEGLLRLRRACDRLKKSTPSKPHPVFGQLTGEEWIKLNLRHAELHLSFLRGD